MNDFLNIIKNSLEEIKYNEYTTILHSTIPLNTSQNNTYKCQLKTPKGFVGFVKIILCKEDEIISNEEVGIDDLQFIEMDTLRSDWVTLELKGWIPTKSSEKIYRRDIEIRYF